MKTEKIFVAGHNGLVGNATWVSGIRGSALEFNGVSSQVDVPGTGFNPTGSGLSISFWFRLTAAGDKGTFIFQNLKYMATMDSQGRIVFSVYTPGMKSLNSGTGSRVLDTDWHHAALTYDGSVMKIFLATWLLEKSQGQSLTACKSRRRLISFFHTKEKKEQLPAYIKTGKNE